MGIEEALSTVRNRNQWTQRELARQLGVRPETVWRWERGRAIPRSSRLRALAHLAGVPASTLVQDSVRSRRAPRRSLDVTAGRIAQALDDWLASRR